VGDDENTRPLTSSLVACPVDENKYNNSNTVLASLGDVEEGIKYK
jgi:hypothetical protein